MSLGWRRRRRHNEPGGVYWNSSKWRPSSWGFQEGPVSWNETNHRGSVRLGWLGQITFGRGRRPGDGGFFASIARFVWHLVVFVVFLVAAVVVFYAYR